MKRQPTECKKICASQISDEGLISKIHKELTQLKSKKPNSPIKNGQNRNFSKEETETETRLTDTENKVVVTKGEKGWGRDKLGIWDQQI